MPYALGIELQAAEVRVATTTELGAESAIEVFLPILFVGNDRVWVGDEASERGLGQPENLVADIVGQFTVDRLWLVGGRMMTPDTALQELLVSLVSVVSAGMAEEPYAITVSCLSEWDDDTRGRVGEVAQAAGLARPVVVSSIDAAAAAFDAAQRLPSGILPISQPDTNDLATGTWVSRSPARIEEDSTVDPIRPEGHRNTWLLTAAGFVGIVAATGVAVALTVLRSHGNGPATTTLPPNSLAPTTILSSPPSTAQGSLLIGFVDASGGSGAMSSAVAEINANHGVLGRPVQLLADPVGSDARATTAALLQRGTSVLITDGDAQLASLLIAGSRANAVVVCSPSGSAVPPSTSSSIELVGSPIGCAELVALAAEYAGSLSPTALVNTTRQFVTQSGVSCTTYAECKSYVDDQQPVSLALTGTVNQVRLNGT